VLSSTADLKPTPEALQLVSETMATVYKVLPLTFKDKVLTVVMSDPNNLPALDDLRNMLGITEVVANLASAGAISEVLSKCLHGQRESIMDVLEELKDTISAAGRPKIASDYRQRGSLHRRGPGSQLINMVFLLAIKDKASDIHFEPFEDEYKMRYRSDGVLYEMVPPPRHLATAISKPYQGHGQPGHRRTPFARRDGRIDLNVAGNRIDMRVSILPTMFGESAVIRVLDRTVVSLDLNKLRHPPGHAGDLPHADQQPTALFS